MAIAKEFLRLGARVLITVRSPAVLNDFEIISGVDVTDNDCGSVLIKGLNGVHIDILVNNAGYFYEESENIKNLNFKEELSMIDICALGPLRITQALFNAGLLLTGSKVVCSLTAVIDFTIF